MADFEAVIASDTTIQETPVSAYQSNQAPEEDQSGDPNSSSDDHLMTDTDPSAEATVNHSIIPTELGTSSLAVESTRPSGGNIF